MASKEFHLYHAATHAISVVQGLHSTEFSARWDLGISSTLDDIGRARRNIALLVVELDAYEAAIVADAKAAGLITDEDEREERAAHSQFGVGA